MLAASPTTSQGMARQNNSGSPQSARGDTRTSETHPITVSWILEHGGGRLGLCHCPGKKVARGGVHWDRCLEKDLQRLRRDYGVTTLVCLLNQAELAHFKLRDYSRSVCAMGFSLAEFPILEMAAPDSVDKTTAFVREMVEMLARGETVVAHCRGGVGRAGLMAACTLLQVGSERTAGGAIDVVRKRRCKGAVESATQVRFIQKYAEKLKLERKNAAPVPTPEAPCGWASRTLCDLRRGTPCDVAAR